MLYDPLSEPEKLKKLVSIEYLSQSEDFAGGDGARKLFQSASEKFEHEHYEDAISDFQQSADVCSKDAYDELWAIHHNIALAYERLGDLKTCVAELEKALGFFSKNSPVLNQLYRVCLKIGEPDYVEKGESYRLMYGMM